MGNFFKPTLQGAILTILSFTGIFSQEINVSGTVSNIENGEPLSGVNVFDSGTGTGTVTDINGHYMLNVPGAETILVFSFVGFYNKEIRVGHQTLINVAMAPETVQLGDVLVTALGLEKEKKLITYAAQKVNTKEISEARELNLSNSFQGRVAGLDVIRSSAGVGSATRLLLRGNRSIAGNNQPLIIVDGVPIQNFTWNSPESEGGGVQTSDGIGDLNPDDIASVTVLKGPNASALYGSRAGNGAIVINTNQGTARKGIGIEFNTNLSMEKALILTEFQDVYGQGNRGTYLRSSVKGWGPKMEGQMVEHWSPDPNWAGPVEYPYISHDNFKDFFRTGYNLANTIKLNAGNERFKGYFSYTNTIAQGIVETNALKRNNFNLRFDANLTDRFSFDAKLTYFKQSVDNRLSTGDDFNNPMRAIYIQPGNISLDQARDFEYFDDAGLRRQHYWHPNYNGGENVYWMLYRTEREETRDRIIGMGSFRYQITEGLSVMMRSSFDKIYDNSDYKRFYDTYIISDAGNLSLANGSAVLLNHDFLLNYQMEFWKDLLSVDISFGGSMLKQSGQGLKTNTNKMLKPNLFVITNTSQILSDQEGQDYQINSLYGYANLGFKNFLFLNLTGRNDWSSTLPENAWSYFYPSVGLTWIITDMFRLQSPILPISKIRVNYAEVGNDTDPYRINKVYHFGAGGQLGYAWRGNTLPADNLKPEKTKSIELGLDIRLFDNRLGLDFTWYQSNTFNQLISVPLPPASGYQYKFINTGNIENKGVELTMDLTPVIAGDFSWDISVNYARNRSRVVELTEYLKEYIIRDRSRMTTIKVVEGEPYGQIYTRGFIRNDEGRILIDASGFPIVSNGQIIPMGNANPDWIGGISNQFQFRGINLSIQIDGRMGGDVFSYTEAIITDFGYSESTLEGRDGFVVDGVNEILNDDGNVTGYQDNTTEIIAEDYWHHIGGRNLPVGESYRYDASYVRIREVLLSYTLNFRSSPFRSIDLSLYGRNLGFLYNAAGIIDPNMSVGTGNIQGIEALSVPSTKTYGVNLRFRF